MDWVGLLVYMQTEYPIDESFDMKHLQACSSTLFSLVISHRIVLYRIVTLCFLFICCYLA